MNEKLKNKHVDQLFEAMLLLQNTEECYLFFEDLCTVSEIHSLAQRLEVAKLLKAGVKYHEITHQTGASAATISRVKRALHYGADGYIKLLERLRNQE